MKDDTPSAVWGILALIVWCCLLLWAAIGYPGGPSPTSTPSTFEVP